jgi:hypothetical protein
MDHMRRHSPAGDFQLKPPKRKGRQRLKRDRLGDSPISPGATDFSDPIPSAADSRGEQFKYDGASKEYVKQQDHNKSRARHERNAPAKMRGTSRQALRKHRFIVHWTDFVF